MDFFGDTFKEYENDFKNAVFAFDSGDLTLELHDI
jgi:hypothetical protein